MFSEGLGSAATALAGPRSPVTRIKLQSLSEGLSMDVRFLPDAEAGIETGSPSAGVSSQFQGYQGF
jgi:hypothetical protein